MSFDVKNETKAGKTVFKFAGNIDENATFPIFNSLAGDIYIDLKGVKSINSVGIRSWIKWFSSFHQVHFIFQHCPKSVVMQMNMVDGFLPEGSHVESLQVPFYCESCEKELEVLFTLGKEILVDGGKVNLKYDRGSICPQGCAPELDVSEAKYFRFLLKYGNMSHAA